MLSAASARYEPARIHASFEPVLDATHAHSARGRGGRSVCLPADRVAEATRMTDATSRMARIIMRALIRRPRMPVPVRLGFLAVVVLGTGAAAQIGTDIVERRRAEFHIQASDGDM